MNNFNAEHYLDPTPTEALKHIEDARRVQSLSRLTETGLLIVLKGVPPSMNHFAGRANQKEYWEAKEQWTALIAAVVGRNRPLIPFGRAVVRITYRFKNHIRRDPDNYCGKLLIDGLTKSGVIKDDSFACIELRLRAENEAGPERTVIEVIERREP